MERRIRSLMSYHFTEKHGEQQEAYLNPSNYSNAPKYTADIVKLIRLLTNMANSNRDHEYIVYQRKSTIMFRYLLPKTDFVLFKKELIQLLNQYEKENSWISKKIVYGYMGFSENWKEITRFRKI